MTIRTVEVPGTQIDVNADIGPGRVVRALLFIEESAPADPGRDPNNLGFDEWEKLFAEMIALSPRNDVPADVSRESMYLSDDEIRNAAG